MNRRVLSVCASLILLGWSLSWVYLAILIRSGSERPPFRVEDLILRLSFGGACAALLLAAAVCFRLPRAVLLLVWLVHLGTSIATVLVTQPEIVAVPVGNGVSLSRNLVIIGAIAEGIGLLAVILSESRRRHRSECAAKGTRAAES